MTSSVLAVLVLVALAALREVSANRVRHAAARGRALRLWRRARFSQSVALGMAAVAFVPTFLDRPEPPILREIYTFLDALAPLLLAMSALAVGIALHAVGPMLVKHLRRQLRAAPEEQAEAETEPEQGRNPDHTSRSLQAWIEENGPPLAYHFDVETTSGIANILVTSSEGRYAVYTLPEAAAQGEGYDAALARAARVAEDLEAQAVVWISNEQSYQPGIREEPMAVTIHGSVRDLLRWIERNALARRKRRERQERRKRQEQHAKEQAGALWGSKGALQARRRHDPEKWDRFTRKAPVHPHMREHLLRAHEGQCALCGFQLEPSSDRWEVMVTDFDHVCRYDGTTRLAPQGLEGPEAETIQEMPDCAECHLEAPQSHDACAQRLAPVHTQCREDRERAGAEDGAEAG